MTTGDIIIILLYAMQAFALLAFLINSAMTRRRIQRLRGRQQATQALAQSLAEQVVQLRSEVHLMAYDLQGLMSRARAEAASPSAKHRAIQQAEQEAKTIEALHTQRLPLRRFPTRPLDEPPPE